MKSSLKDASFNQRLTVASASNLESQIWRTSTHLGPLQSRSNTMSIHRRGRFLKSKSLACSCKMTKLANLITTKMGLFQDFSELVSNPITLSHLRQTTTSQTWFSLYICHPRWILLRQIRHVQEFRVQAKRYSNVKLIETQRHLALPMRCNSPMLTRAKSKFLSRTFRTLKIMSSPVLSPSRLQLMTVMPWTRSHLTLQSIFTASILVLAVHRMHRAFVKIATPHRSKDTFTKRVAWLSAQMAW